MVELETDSVLKEAIAMYKNYGFKILKKPVICSRCDMVMCYLIDKSYKPKHGEIVEW